MSSSETGISPDTIVALAIGLPSLLATTLALWVTYLTLTYSRRPLRAVSWPELTPTWLPQPSCELPVPPNAVISRQLAELA